MYVFEFLLHRVVEVFGGTLFPGLFISVPWNEDGHGSHYQPIHPYPGARTGHYWAGNQHILRIEIQRKGQRYIGAIVAATTLVVVHGSTFCFFSFVWWWCLVRVSLFAATSPCRRLGSSSTRVTDITLDTYQGTIGLCRVVVAHAPAG